MALLSSHFTVTPIGISNPPWTSGDGFYFIAVTSPFMTASLCSACQIYRLNSIGICPTVEGNMVPDNIVCPATANRSYLLSFSCLNVSCCLKMVSNLCDTRDNLLNQCWISMWKRLHPYLYHSFFHWPTDWLYSNLWEKRETLTAAWWAWQKAPSVHCQYKDCRRDYQQACYLWHFDGSH